MKISACWIVKNEEENLPRSIESLKDAVDELIVVDTGSEDRTVEIAAAYGARVAHYSWEGDFAAARNHALDLASGELVFFLDADEWFEPALTPDDAREMSRFFEKDPRLDGLQLPIWHVKEGGVANRSSVVLRLLRRSSELHYRGRIHEQYAHRSGESCIALLTPRWRLYHSGYLPEIIASKVGRNIAMLRSSLAELPSDHPDVLFQHCYLVRELHTGGFGAEAWPSVRVMLENPARLQALWWSGRHNFISFIANAINAAAIPGSGISRRRVHEALIVPFPAMHPDDPAAPLIELVYQGLFDLREDRLLLELPLAREAAHRLPTPVEVNGWYQTWEGRLCVLAAHALWRRGAKMKAMEYLVEVFRIPSVKCGLEEIKLLLRCLQGQTTADAAWFLSGLLDLKESKTLPLLIEATRLQGWRELHLYYIKKQIEAGDAPSTAYYALSLLTGQYRELVDLAEFAESAQDSIQTEGGAQIQVQNAVVWLFLAAVCGGQEWIYREHPAQLTACARVLEAFFADRSLVALSEEDRVWLAYYPHIAFAAAPEIVGRFLRVFAVDPRSCYLVRAAWLLDNALYEELLAEDISAAGSLDAEVRIRHSEALLMTGRHSEALAQLKALLAGEAYQAEMLHQLLVIAETGGETGQEARALYDAYLTVVEKNIDLQDVVDSGLTFSSYGKQAKRALRSLDQSYFEQLLAKDRALPKWTRLLRLCPQAAECYERDGLYPEALECWRFMLAHDYETGEARKGLARNFGRLGNKALRRFFTDVDADAEAESGARLRLVSKA